MKKFLFSAAVLMGAMGICIANSSDANAKLPAETQTYIIKDTVPGDTTTKPTDSTLLLK